MFRLRTAVGNRLYIDIVQASVDFRTRHLNLHLAVVWREGKTIKYAHRIPTHDGRVQIMPPTVLLPINLDDPAETNPAFDRALRLIRRAFRVFDTDIQGQLESQQSWDGADMVPLASEIDDDPDVIPEDQGLLREIQACTVALDALKVAAQREMDRRDSVRDGEME